MPIKSSRAIQKLSPRVDDFREEILNGLLAPKKWIPTKFLYDAVGSLLFERITQLEEYYLTRIERQILLRYRWEIASQVAAGAIILEYGPGSGEKLELILQALRSPAACFPLDISRKPLFDTANMLAKNYPGLAVHPICADFYEQIDPKIFEPYRDNYRLALFFGSTIGNLERESVVRFLKNVADTVGPGGGLVIGVDLVKDKAILEDAYNDVLGLTSQFNLNILSRINRELNANFDLAFFRHNAFFNSTMSRIEMHLESQRSQVVRIGDFPILFEEGESIHTENSYKYRISDFHELAKSAGFTPKATWTDDFAFFSVQFLQVANKA